ncbi:MAG TPA: TonB-dependent receptor, partial [Allosphingosinicella sp.]
EARFELLTVDGVDRIDIMRGPYSAFFGSEAIGGVVSVHTNQAHWDRSLEALAEYGGLDSARLSASAGGKAGRLEFGATAGWHASEGMDSFGSGGDKDGFENRSASFKAILRPSDRIKLGAVGRWIDSVSEFDGLDPLTFRRADTLDETRNRIAAGRLWGQFESGGWIGTLESSLLASANRNRLDEAPLNRTAGRRVTGGAQLSRRFAGHRLTAALDHEAEDFRARDQVHFGGTDQDRSRSLTALVGEWHGTWSDALTTSLAVRHDAFSAFRDETTVRAAAILRPSREWTLLASYGEGIAQPTFYDLFGFFPGSFAGNPELRPERSRGFEAGIAWRRGAAGLRAAAFTNRLKSEIVDVFDPATFLSSARNVEGASRRRGVEVAGEYGFGEALRLQVNYTFLDADERREPADAAIREVRRPRHSANLIAFGEAGRLSWSATAAYVGARDDLDTDPIPAQRVRLGGYVLGSLRLGWALGRGVEAFGRVANAFAADYQDVFGYETPGRTVHAGLRFRLGS